MLNSNIKMLNFFSLNFNKLFLTENFNIYIGFNICFEFNTSNLTYLV
jgi:hypothetical protein